MNRASRAFSRGICAVQNTRISGQVYKPPYRKLLKRTVTGALKILVAPLVLPFFPTLVDDKSTDNSIDLIQLALNELDDSRFRFIERDQNGGQMAAMLTGFDATSAPFVAFLDADDVWLPSFLETHIGIHLSSGIRAAFSCTNLAIIDSGGVLVAGSSTPGKPIITKLGEGIQRFQIEAPGLRREAAEISTRRKQDVTFVKNAHFGWVWSATSGLVFRRAVVEAIRPATLGDYRICADFYLATFAQIVGGSLLTCDVHGYYRIHGTNMWAKNAVLGYGATIGTEPPSVRIATHRTIIEMLSANESLKRLVPAAHATSVVSRLAKKEYSWIASNPAIMCHLSLSQKLKIRRRQVSRLLRSFFKKPK